MTFGSKLPARITFGRFRIVPHRRELLSNDRPITLGGRAFDVLMALIEAHGSVVSKDALMARVWPNQVVEENNLEVQISILRAAFGAERALIRTVPRRGYQFTGEVRFPAGEIGALSEGGDQRASLGPARAEPGVLPPTNMPEPVSELIGRDHELAEVVSLMDAHRLVTLTGAGGIGKTRLAVAAARVLRPRFADGVWLVQLSPLADPKLVPAAVVAAVELEFSGEASVQSVARALAGRQLLLVLDTCEHVIEVAASMAEAALGTGSELRILATSREVLKAEGEWIYSVPPLAVPTADAEHEDFSGYGAIRLFLERARAANRRFAPDRPLIELIAAICRQLDGLPLAIELAAARASALGIEELATHLDDRFRLLTGGRRTALPRHQTLLATLDWSYDVLSEPERIVLRRLAIFAGTFDLDAARAVVTGPELSASAVVDGIDRLIAKSLLQAEIGSAIVRYRLLDTTRAYSLEKLVRGDERGRLAQRHTEYFRDLFKQAEAEWEARPTAEWLADYRCEIDNLRAALDWAFSSHGDAMLGVELAAAAVPLWMHLSLLDECHRRAEQAIAALGAGERPDPRLEMKLHAALASSYTQADAHQSDATWTKALELAVALGDTEYQLRSLRGLYSFYIQMGRLRIALDMAHRFRSLAADRRRDNDALIGDRMIGTLQHVLGDQASAQRHIKHMLANFVLHSNRSHELIRFQFDQRVTALTVYARSLWVLGFPDEAQRSAASAVDEARKTNHAHSLCYSLAHSACLAMLLVEDLAAAERYITMLRETSVTHALASWGRLACKFHSVLLIRTGQTKAGLALLRAGLDESSSMMSHWISLMLLAELAAGLGRAGQAAEGLTAIEQAIELAEQTEKWWLSPEFLRIKGELVLLHAADDALAVAEGLYRQALDLARKQNALAWELRAAVSLARLWRDQTRSDEADKVLAPVYDRFTEGFDTADLKAARALLLAIR